MHAPLLASRSVHNTNNTQPPQQQMCATAGCFECVSIFSGKLFLWVYRRLYRLAPPTPPASPGVSWCRQCFWDCSTDLSPLCGRWDSFQLFNTSDADVEGTLLTSERCHVTNKKKKKKRSSSLKWKVKLEWGTAMNHIFSLLLMNRNHYTGKEVAVLRSHLTGTLREEQVSWKQNKLSVYIN